MSDIRACGGAAHGYRVDITDDALVQMAARRVEAEVGAVDVLINNAGFVSLFFLGCVSCLSARCCHCAEFLVNVVLY